MNLLRSCCHIFARFRNNGGINWTLQIRISLNALECPIQLKVRFTDGTLDVRLLRVSDSTVRIGVPRGGRESGLEGLAPSMWAADALFLSGS